MWDELRGIVGAVAPTIATALGGPLAGGAVKALTGALGLDEDASPETVKQALKDDPEALVRIKEAELAYAEVVAKAGVDLERIAAGDRASARGREIASGDPWTPRLLGAVVIAGFFYCIYMVMTGKVANITDPLLAGTVGTLIGYASAKADQVVSYYFGSSSGSRDKDAVIKDLKR